jgi:hypothetical protein
MQGNCQLDSLQAGGKVFAAGADTLDKKSAQLLRQYRKLGHRQAPQLLWSIDRLEQQIRAGRENHARECTLRVRVARAEVIVWTWPIDALTVSR